MKTIYIILLITLLLIVSGCLSIKSEYPDIVYYKLHTTQLQDDKLYKTELDKSIFIKTFSVIPELETSKIIVNHNESIIKQYNYHQWTDNLNEVLTNFTINRFRQYNIFKKGVMTSVYSSTPDIILECNIMECFINYHLKNISLYVTATMLVANTTILEYTSVFSKTYSQTINISYQNIVSATDAIAIAIAKINDNILLDIIQNTGTVQNNN